MAVTLIRPATAKDVEEIVSLERQVPEAPHWSMAEYEAMVGVDSKEGLVRRCLLVAEMGGGLAGFAVGKVVGTAQLGELESLAVRPSARRMGTGMQLCREAVDWCESQGATRVELEVRAGSASAIRLYERLGFVVDGVRRGYYAEPADDALLMRLDFAPAGRFSS